MKDIFEKIEKQETNEKTALILMMSVLDKRLEKNGELIKETNSVSQEILKMIKETKPKKIGFSMNLSPEDYD